MIVCFESSNIRSCDRDAILLEARVGVTDDLESIVQSEAEIITIIIIIIVYTRELARVYCWIAVCLESMH